MTIAAGFKFKDGILLCADTEQTQGDLKFAGSKIISADLRPSATIAFAIAGDVSYATMAAQEIISELRKAEQDHESIEATVKDRISDIYTRLLYPHPRAAYSDAPSFDLLIAVWAENSTRLLVSKEAAIAEVSTYECIGIGLTLAKYLIKPLYQTEMKLREIEMIAIRTLIHVKENTAYCGQESEFLHLESSGKIFPLKSLTAQNNIIGAFDGLLPLAFFCAGDLEAPDDDIKAALNLLEEALLNEREKARIRLTKKHFKPSSSAT